MISLILKLTWFHFFLWLLCCFSASIYNRTSQNCAFAVFDFSTSLFSNLLSSGFYLYCSTSIVLSKPPAISTLWKLSVKFVLIWFDLGVALDRVDSFLLFHTLSLLGFHHTAFLGFLGFPLRHVFRSLFVYLIFSTISLLQCPSFQPLNSFSFLYTLILLVNSSSIIIYLQPRRFAWILNFYD